MTYCNYCQSGSLRITHRHETHKVDKTLGPFDLYICDSCGSMGTANPPSPRRLAEFYRQYDDFRPDWYKSGTRSGAIAAQYRFYASQVTASGNWLDIGAGHGEVANIVASTNPNGLVVDIGPRPPQLNPTLPYKSIDMNRANWSSEIGEQSSNVFSIAVWEHVLSPKEFAKECLSLVAPGGRLTLICPDYGSLARKVLNRYWPYFEPGEHISIPSRAGARACLMNAAAELSFQPKIEVSRLNVGYSIKYLFDVLRLNWLASAIPPGVSVPMPTGVLIAKATRH